ncbi:DNA cytosine methyltransferase [Methylibium petroleiphilum]
MLTPQFGLDLAHELVVDLFAGGGGASTGIEQAIGRPVDIAVNHDPQAVALHRANHPQTEHFTCDVFEIDPLTVTKGRPVGLLWASPDCKHFSKAKGGKPVSKKIRGLAWVVIKWAKLAKPRVIHLENVEEFKTWGPLTADGMPCPQRKGSTFRRWTAQLENLGYKVEFKELRGCDYGAPTIRKRLFMIARCDGQPIVWPEPTHAAKPAKGSKLKPWRTAADCIDWSIPCPSIFERDRELAPATMRRIAHGVKRYVLENPKPFIVPVMHQGDNRVHGIDEPLRTITTAQRGEFAVIKPKFVCVHCSFEMVATHKKCPACLKIGPFAVPTMIQTGYGERPGQAPRVPGLDKPLGTCVDGQKHALVAAFMVKHFGGEPQPGKTSQPIDKPAPTVMASGGPQGIVTSNLVKLRGTSNSAATDAPLGTVSAGGWHHAEVRAFLIRYFGTDQDPRIEEPLHTVTTKHRDAVVTVEGADYFIADIGMRMLQPRELYRAQGFPDSYIIDRGLDAEGNWITLTKSAQVRMCGNSVCPPLSRAIVAANYSDLQPLRMAA